MASQRLYYFACSSAPASSSTSSLSSALFGSRLLEKGSYRSANYHFERAEAEAETALSLARARIAEDEAREAEARLGEAPAETDIVDSKPEVQINVDD